MLRRLAGFHRLLERLTVKRPQRHGTRRLHSSCSGAVVHERKLAEGAARLGGVHLVGRPRALGNLNVTQTGVDNVKVVSLVTLLDDDVAIFLGYSKERVDNIAKFRLAKVSKQNIRFQTGR